MSARIRSELPSFRQAAVAERLELLRDVLSTSVALAEQENIRAAITGYDDGAIPYSAAWTLIYAGRIVDTCPTYSSFCLDRSARLDRYAAAHGPGFLWYEPPLQRASGDPNGDAELLAYKGTCLGNERGRRHDSYGMGHWDVHMGFRRRNEFTSRTLTPREGRILAASDFRKATAPDTEAKTVFFEMLADSGATLPVLDSGDLALLGIQRGKYAAQSAQSVATAGGSKNGFIYEMDCGIYAGANEGETLVTADKDIWPAEPQVLGGTIPVLVLERVKTRLSGMLMWHVCYTSSAPGTFKCWIGEDRMEVLGAGRMPGQMRWSGWKHDDDTVVRSRGTLKTGNPPWMTSDLGTPTRVMFLHEGPSTQRDSEDDSEHTSDAGGKNDSETDPNTGTGGEGDVSNKKVMDNQQAKGKSSIWRVPQEMDWGHAVTGMPGVERWIIEPRASASQQRALARQREAVERKKKNGPGKESSGKQGNVAWKLWNYMSP